MRLSSRVHLQSCAQQRTQLSQRKMSRGGGGFRGGRGGRGGFGGGKQMIGGQEVSWDFDPDLVIETKPQEMFPVSSNVTGSA